MKIQPRQIIDGFTNLALDKLDMLDSEIQTLAYNRYKQCFTCTLRTNNRCDPNKEGPCISKTVNGDCSTSNWINATSKGCGCNLHAKVRAKGSQCPIGKW